MSNNSTSFHFSFTCMSHCQSWVNQFGLLHSMKEITMRDFHSQQADLLIASGQPLGKLKSGSEAKAFSSVLSPQLLMQNLNVFFCLTCAQQKFNNKNLKTAKFVPGYTQILQSPINKN